MTAFELSEDAPLPDGRVRVRATLHSGGASYDFVFTMEHTEFGSKKGCWLTKSLLPADSPHLQ